MEKRDERAARELAFKRKQEEDRKRYLEEKERQAAELRRKMPGFPIMEALYPRIRISL